MILFGKKEKVKPIKTICNKVETVNEFCYLGDQINANGECEAAVMVRMRLGLIKFTECGQLLLGRIYLLKIKGRIYQSCLQLVMLHGSKIWCLREKELTILQRTERAMCGVKMMNRKNINELMDMLELEENMDKITKSN